MTDHSWDEVIATFEHLLVPRALGGLRKMLLPNEACFCFRLRQGANGRLEQCGRSERYTAMALIGLLAGGDRTDGHDLPTEKLIAFIEAWALGNSGLGDKGLALWAMSLHSPQATQRVLAAILDRQAELRPGLAFPLMEMGWLLAGLSYARLRHGISPAAESLAATLAQRLMDAQEAHTGLFPLSGATSRRNLLAERLTTRLGSFASQVYPIIGLSTYARAAGSAQPLQRARACAERICDLQGEGGQWWWIYNLHTGIPAIRYPVYSVHQDAMGPMALLSIALCAQEHAYTDAIAKSVRWMTSHPEMPQASLIDGTTGLLWRAIQRDNPRATGAFGLGLAERLRMHGAAWMATPDNRPFRQGFICDECRPYHLGWILLANAWLTELVQAPDRLARPMGAPDDRA